MAFGLTQAIRKSKEIVPPVETIEEDDSGKVYYHCYVCPSLDCLAANNPHNGSMHQRGIHLATSKPRKDVKCAGCGGRMVIGGSTNNPDDYKTDSEGNLIEIKGPKMIHEAAGQLDQSNDDSLFVKEEA